MATSPSTIGELLQQTVAKARNRKAIATACAGKLQWRTWGELNTDVRRLADGLRNAGVGQGERVAQYAPNSYEWIVADLAVLAMGAVHVPLHSTLSRPQAVELLERADARLMIVDQPYGFPVPCVTHEQLYGTAAALPEMKLDASALATILFTSGTTGRPQGVMLSHGNLLSNTAATAQAVGARSDERRLVLLPLSHIYARTCDLYSWLQRGTQLVLAEGRDTIVRDVQLAQPTVINGVPYFYQKIAQQLHQAGKLDQSGVIQKLLGGKVKRLFCGGAAVAPEVEALFAKQGLPLLSGYGLTEASPVVSAASIDNYTPGTVGRPLSNLEVELAADGEILVRGPSVMLGYWQDEAATREVVVDGWLRSGDLGEFDAAGNLRIVGRKKEIIVLSTGKNVSPTVLEQRLASSPLIEHACVVGEGRKCLGVLIVPNPQAIRAEIRQRRLWVWSKRRAVTHPQIRALYRREIDRLLADLDASQQMGPVAILPENFSGDRGELTPKMSLCRGRIALGFARTIDRMYREFLPHH